MWVKVGGSQEWSQRENFLSKINNVDKTLQGQIFVHCQGSWLRKVNGVKWAENIKPLLINFLFFFQRKANDVLLHTGDTAPKHHNHKTLSHKLNSQLSYNRFCNSLRCKSFRFIWDQLIWSTTSTVITNNKHNNCINMDNGLCLLNYPQVMWQGMGEKGKKKLKSLLVFVEDKPFLIWMCSLNSFKRFKKFRLLSINVNVSLKIFLYFFETSSFESAFQLYLLSLS